MTDSGIVNGDEFDVKEEFSRTGTGGELVCAVCGDLATGKHYGAVACNGCKGFFRRTIRRQYKYTCRFERNCSLNKHNRAICRYCRYMRCVRAGMKEDQVQNERDIIGKRVRTNSGTSVYGNKNSGSVKRHQSCEDVQTSKRGSPEVASGDPWDDPEGIIESLLRSENTIQNLRDTVIKQAGSVEYSTLPEQLVERDGKRTATINDILKSMHSQLLLVIEWAKTIPPFAKLSTQDQTILLKGFSCHNIVLGVSYRSKDAKDFLRLINDSLIPRASSLTNERQHGFFYLKDCEKVMDEMVAPMRFLSMDDSEFVLIKACVFFNPVTKGLSSESAMYILETRRKIFAALQHYVQTRKPEDKTRIGDLMLFTLGPLSSLANSMMEDIRVTQLTGAARIDILMEELILVDTEDNHTVQTRAEVLPCNEVVSFPPPSQAVSTDASPSSFPCYSQSTSIQPVPHLPSLPVADDVPFDGCPTFGSYLFDGNSQSNSPSLAANPMWSSPVLGTDATNIYSTNGL